MLRGTGDLLLNHQSQELQAAPYQPVGAEYILLNPVLLEHGILKRLRNDEAAVVGSRSYVRRRLELVSLNAAWPLANRG